MRIYVQGSLFIMLFLLSSLHINSAAEPAHDEALLQRLVAKHGNHKTAQGTLQWLTRNTADLTAAPRVQLVQFYLEFPDKYHVIITKPGDTDWKQRFICNGTTRWEVQQLFADERPDVKTTPVGKDDALEKQLMACFNFNIASLTKDFSLNAHASADNTPTVLLKPTSTELQKQLLSLTMIFDGELALQRIISDDPQGNRFEFHLEKVECDKNIDTALFTLDQ